MNSRRRFQFGGTCFDGRRRTETNANNNIFPFCCCCSLGIIHFRICRPHDQPYNIIMNEGSHLSRKLYGFEVVRDVFANFEV